MSIVFPEALPANGVVPDGTKLAANLQAIQAYSNGNIAPADLSANKGVVAFHTRLLGLPVVGDWIDVFGNPLSSDMVVVGAAAFLGTVPNLSFVTFNWQIWVAAAAAWASVYAVDKTLAHADEQKAVLYTAAGVATTTCAQNCGLKFRVVTVDVTGGAVADLFVTLFVKQQLQAA